MIIKYTCGTQQVSFCFLLCYNIIVRVIIIIIYNQYMFILCVIYIMSQISTSDICFVQWKIRTYQRDFGLRERGRREKKKKKHKRNISAMSNIK